MPPAESIASFASPQPLVSTFFLRKHLRVLRVRGLLVRRQRILLQLVEHHFNRFLELRIAALTDYLRLHPRLELRRDTAILHSPLTLESVDRATRRGDRAAVDQFRIIPDPDQ